MGNNFATKINVVIDENKSVQVALKEWYELIYEKKKKKKVWTTLACLPQYKFKNLEIISDDKVNENNEVEFSFTLEYDEYKDIKI